MKKIRKILSMMMVLAFVFTMLPAINAEAATVTVNGGYTTRTGAYNWGAYSTTNSILVVLPETENDFWVKYTLPSNKRVYARCSYETANEGMSFETLNATGAQLDEANSDEIYGSDTVIPFMAIDCDNLTSSTQTYYIHVERGTCVGKMYFTLSMNERIKTGRGVFSFSGSSTNPGNTAVNLAGVNSSILSLNLTNNTTIPPAAIVTSVRTSGTQSPNQGNVHHMIFPATQGSTWYTATVTSATSGSYNISNADNFNARQLWQFRYNALATAKSTMSSVKLTLEWEYDIASTSYKAY